MLTIYSPAADIADAYDRAPVVTDRARRAYTLLTRYVDQRFVRLHDLGWRVAPTLSDEPPDLDVVMRTRVLPVYDRAHAHPVLTDAQNYCFRAVHDIFGHLGTTPYAPFGYTGEVFAAASQARDFRIWATATMFPSPSNRRDAMHALLTEIVGQAAYFEVHGRFPVQKAAIIFGDQGGAR